MRAPQIMGFNHEPCGYRTPREMFDAFCSGDAPQIRGFSAFLSPTMLRHLQAGDFTAFAGMYDGSGQKERYGGLIRDHCRACKRLV